MDNEVTDPNINRSEHDTSSLLPAKRVKGYVWNPTSLTWEKQTSTASFISLVNSSTTVLAANGVFTGIGEDVSSYAAIQVAVFSAQASATNGLSLQQSTDNTNWDFTDTYTIPAGTGKIYSVQPAARYFRLVYTNGATLQTSFRIQTVYHVVAPNPSSQRAADAYSNETDLSQVWAFNSLFNGSTWDLMRTIGAASTTTATGIQAAAIIPNLGTPTFTLFTNNGLVNTAVQIKGTAGKMYDLHIGAPNISMTYLQFYDVPAATAVTVGTTTPSFVFAIPANGILDRSMVIPYAFVNGLKVAATTGPTNGITPANSCNITVGVV